MVGSRGRGVGVKGWRWWGQGDGGAWGQGMGWWGSRVSRGLVRGQGGGGVKERV